MQGMHGNARCRSIHPRAPFAPPILWGIMHVYFTLCVGMLLSIKLVSVTSFQEIKMGLVKSLIGRAGFCWDEPHLPPPTEASCLFLPSPRPPMSGAAPGDPCLPGLCLFPSFQS